MGLDVYVGPLSRYFAREWETIVQQAGREMGIPVEIRRPADEAPPPVEEVHEAVLAWRRALGGSVAVVIADPLDWSEAPQVDYTTDKLDWDGHAAVLLLAAQQEFPEMTLPATAPWDLEPTSLWQLVLDRYGNPGGRIRARVTRLLGRTPPKHESSPFAHLYFPQLWLPADFEAPFQSIDPAGRPMVFGSVRRLRLQLEQLNARTFRADDATLAEWGRDGLPDDRDFTATARFGLAAWLRLARDADDGHLPMILDW